LVLLNKWQKTGVNIYYVVKIIPATIFYGLAGLEIFSDMLINYQLFKSSLNTLPGIDQL